MGPQQHTQRLANQQPFDNPNYPELSSSPDTEEDYGSYDETPEEKMDEEETTEETTTEDTRQKNETEAAIIKVEIKSMDDLLTKLTDKIKNASNNETDDKVHAVLKDLMNTVQIKIDEEKTKLKNLETDVTQENDIEDNQSADDELKEIIFKLKHYVEKTSGTKSNETDDVTTVEISTLKKLIHRLINISDHNSQDNEDIDPKLFESDPTKKNSNNTLIEEETILKDIQKNQLEESIEEFDESSTEVVKNLDVSDNTTLLIEKYSVTEPEVLLKNETTISKNDIKTDISNRVMEPHIKSIKKIHISKTLENKTKTVELNIPGNQEEEIKNEADINDNKTKVITLKNNNEGEIKPHDKIKETKVHENTQKTKEENSTQNEHSTEMEIKEIEITTIQPFDEQNEEQSLESHFDNKSINDRLQLNDTNKMETVEMKIITKNETENYKQYINQNKTLKNDEIPLMNKEASNQQNGYIGNEDYLVEQALQKLKMKLDKQLKTFNNSENEKREFFKNLKLLKLLEDMKKKTNKNLSIDLLEQSSYKGINSKAYKTLSSLWIMPKTNISKSTITTQNFTANTDRYAKQINTSSSSDQTKKENQLVLNKQQNVIREENISKQKSKIETIPEKVRKILQRTITAIKNTKSPKISQNAGNNNNKHTTITNPVNKIVDDQYKKIMETMNNVQNFNNNKNQLQKATMEKENFLNKQSATSKMQKIEVEKSEMKMSNVDEEYRKTIMAMMRSQKQIYRGVNYLGFHKDIRITPENVKVYISFLNFSTTPLILIWFQVNSARATNSFPTGPSSNIRVKNNASIGTNLKKIGNKVFSYFSQMVQDAREMNERKTRTGKY